MSLFHDWRDWLGGYPFEVARPEEVMYRLGVAGFELKHQTLTQGLGCNEFVFTRNQGNTQRGSARDESFKLPRREQVGTP